MDFPVSKKIRSPDLNNRVVRCLLQKLVFRYRINKTKKFNLKNGSSSMYTENPKFFQFLRKIKV